MPTATGTKLRVLVLGTGPDSESARSLPDNNDNVVIAAKFTKTVTHLIVDDTVKPGEARLKKATETGIPVVTLSEFQALLNGEELEISDSEEDATAEDEAEVSAATDSVVTEDETSSDPTADVVESAEVDDKEATATVPAQASAPAEEDDAVVADADVDTEVAQTEVAKDVEATVDSEVETDSKNDVDASGDTESAPELGDKVADLEAEAQDKSTSTEGAPKSKPGFMARLRSFLGAGK